MNSVTMIPCVLPRQCTKHERCKYLREPVCNRRCVGESARLLAHKRRGVREEPLAKSHRRWATNFFGCELNPAYIESDEARQATI